MLEQHGPLLDEVYDVVGVLQNAGLALFLQCETWGSRVILCFQAVVQIIEMVASPGARAQSGDTSAKIRGQDLLTPLVPKCSFSKSGDYQGT